MRTTVVVVIKWWTVSVIYAIVIVFAIIIGLMKVSINYLRLLVGK